MADGDELTLDLLPDDVTGRQTPDRFRLRTGDLESLVCELVECGLTTAGPQEDNLHAKIVSRVERELISQVLDNSGGVRIKAAARLGINRNTLANKLKEYGMDDNDGAAAK